MACAAVAPSSVSTSPAALVGGRAPARLRARAEPDRGTVVQPQGRRAGQPHLADPGRGDRPGPPRCRARAPHAASGLLVPAPCWPVGLMTHQPDTQGPLTGSLLTMAVGRDG